MEYEQKLVIPSEMVGRLQKILSIEDFDKANVDLDEFRKVEIGDALLFCKTIRFPNGYQADIEVCYGMHNAYVDASLFDGQGNKIFTCEPDDTLLGTYCFHGPMESNDEYTVEVVSSETEDAKTELKNHKPSGWETIDKADLPLLFQQKQKLVEAYEHPETLDRDTVAGLTCFLDHLLDEAEEKGLFQYPLLNYDGEITVAALENKTRYVSQAEALKIIKTRKPIGLFYTKESNGQYTGIDNSNGDAWVEEFRNPDICQRWLNGDFEVGDEDD